MSRIRNRTTLAVVIFGGLVAFGSHLARTNFVEKSKTEDQLRDELQRRKARVEDEIREIDEQRNQLIASFRNRVKSSGVQGKSAAEAPPPSWVRSWRENPELLNLKLKAQRARLASAFNPFFERFHIPAAEQEQLLDIALRAEEQKMDVDAAISEGRLTYADAEVGKLLQKIRADYQSSARTLLGDTTYEAFRAFDRTRQLRESLNSVIGNAASRGTPLSREEAEAFITVVAESAKNPNSDDPIYPTDVDWSKVEAGASNILSAAQVSSLMRYDPMGFGTAGPLFVRFNQLINKAAAQDRAAKPSAPNG